MLSHRSPRLPEYTDQRIAIRGCDVRYSAMPGVSHGVSRRGSDPVRYRRPCRRPGCSWGGGRGSCGPALAHRGAWIRVAGSDLDVPEVHTGVKHGRDEGVAELVWVRAGETPPLIAALESLRI